MDKEIRREAAGEQQKTATGSSLFTSENFCYRRGQLINIDGCGYLYGRGLILISYFKMASEDSRDFEPYPALVTWVSDSLCIII